MLSESLANLTTDVLIVLILGAILVMEVVTMLNQARQAGSMRKLEKQARNYMQEDLRIKRGQLEHEMEDAIAVQDPKGWLESVIGSVTGLRPELQELQSAEISPGVKVIIGDTQDFKRYILTPAIPPIEVYKMADPKYKEGLEARTPSVFGKNPKKNLEPIELSVLNAGIFFDRQAKTVWAKIAHQDLSTDELMLYALDLA
jgi:hypothetical protein